MIQCLVPHGGQPDTPPKPHKHGMEPEILSHEGAVMLGLRSLHGIKAVAL